MIQNTDGNKNILVVYHRLDVIGGIETRWMDEFSYLNQQGFNTHLFTNKNEFNPDLISLFSDCKITAVPFADINVASEFVSLVEHLVCYIEDNGIDVISVHMQNLFAFAAVIASQLCHVPIISTTHGILELYQQPIEKILFGHIARHSFSMNAYVNYLPYSVGFPLEKKHKIVIPNLINLDKYRPDNSLKIDTWLMVSRISEEKFPSILQFIQLAHHCQVTDVHIAGGGDSQRLLNELDSQYADVNITFLGECKNIPELLPKYTLLAGMGRVALEGLACQIPVCIITPDGKTKGLVTPNNFDRLKSYNFTGNTLKTVTPNEFATQLLNYNQAEMISVYQLLKHHLSTEKWQDYVLLYKACQFTDNQILNRLFHKLTYFSKNFTTPFLNDDLFQNLLYETLLECHQKEILDFFEFYQARQGLNSYYPNPYDIPKAKLTKKPWWK